jgi:hypothetical protein
VWVDGAWNDDGSYEMWVEGKVRETVVFGEKIEMHRRISAKLGESKIWIHDRITNLGHQETPHMVLYHMNTGFPLVDAGARLVAPIVNCQPRDADAEDGKDEHAVFTDPVDGFAEKVYYLDLAEDADGYTTVGLVNPGFDGGRGFGMYVRYSKKELPRLVQWKMMAKGSYVVGIEPSNCWVGGRAAEREMGTLQFLQPGETREYHIEIGVLSSTDEIRQFEETVKSIKG